MIVKYFLLVLTFITTFVILVHSQSPHVSLSSYQYDPNSIPQNEKILQLFLRLASHTAGKLHLLKHKTLEQQLHDLKENEKIAKTSQSDLNIKNMIETFLRLSSASISPTQNPLSPNLYQPQNPVAQNNLQSTEIKSASEEISTDSKEIPEASGNSLEVQSRIMVDYDKDYKASNPRRQNILNFGSISPRINLGTDSESLNKNGSNSSNGESSNNQQNSNQNSSGKNQVGQDPGSIFTTFNPAKLANVNPMNMVSNVPVIGSGLAGHVNTAQETFSKFGSFVPQLRALPDIENDINSPVPENLVEENQTNGNFSQNPTTNRNIYSSPDNIFVTEEAFSMDQNKTNNTEGVTAESTLIFDTETTTNSNHLDEVRPDGKKSNLSEQNSAEKNSLKEEIQRVDEIEGNIQKEKNVEDLDFPKESLKQNSEEKSPLKKEIQRVDNINNKINSNIEKEEKFEEKKMPEKSFKENSAETNPLKEEIQRIDEINNKITGKIEKEEKIKELQLPKESLKQNSAEKNPLKEENQRVDRINNKIKGKIEKEQKVKELKFPKEILEENSAERNPLKKEKQRIDRINNKIKGEIEKEEKVDELELPKDRLKQNYAVTNPLWQQIQRLSKMNNAIKGKIEKDEKVDELELPKENLKPNKENNYIPDYQDMQLKILTIQLMKELRDMQNKIDHRAKRKELYSSSDFRS
ncbi:putative uncharacterized protein DDB_G0286901 isoform X2 [Belonocnema kinseyi]|uniref:putative uncharacterized protein DDB_G0286901 isoform X2 n=1 Tax=Belonocnema kinseyi TaxID=2817044 RepID=UPI00143D1669|nr:putative uncharacterized protein DDB_G0286901 isoform X2 [Belonocnema kinseyi]